MNTYDPLWTGESGADPLDSLRQALYGEIAAQAPARPLPSAGVLPGTLHLNPQLAPSVPAGSPRPFAPGEWIQNPNGSWSSEISTTLSDPHLAGGRPVNIPTLWLVNGKPERVSEDQAVQYAIQSGLPWRSYSSMQAADAAARQREAEWQKVQPGPSAAEVPSLWAPNPSPSVLGALQDPRFWGDMAHRAAAMFGAPLLSGKELDALMPRPGEKVSPALHAEALRKAVSMGGAGIFAGEHAATADLKALGIAKDLEDAGVDVRDIWSKTGWWRGPDGKWRFEISDYGTKPTRLKERNVTALASELLDHPDLYSAYPRTSDWSGNYTPGIDAVPVSREINPRLARPSGERSSQQIWARGATPEATRSVMLHELQHEVQAREGFARGANAVTLLPSGHIDVEDLPSYKAVAKVLKSLDLPEKPPASVAPEVWAGGMLNSLMNAGEYDAASKMGDLVDEIVNKHRDWKRIAYNKYQRSMGEAEARATQARRHMTSAQRRATPPWESYDVPLDELWTVQK